MLMMEAAHRGCVRPPETSLQLIYLLSPKNDIYTFFDLKQFQVTSI